MEVEEEAVAVRAKGIMRFVRTKETNQVNLQLCDYPYAYLIHVVGDTWVAEDGTLWSTVQPPSPSTQGALPRDPPANAPRIWASVSMAYHLIVYANPIHLYGTHRIRKIYTI